MFDRAPPCRQEPDIRQAYGVRGFTAEACSNGGTGSSGPATKGCDNVKAHLPSIRSINKILHPARPQNTATSRPETICDPDDVVIDCAAYIDGERLDLPHDPEVALAKVREHGNGFVWVGLHEPSAENMAEMARIFGLHELAVEDAVVAHQRPKMERYENHLFLVLKTVKYVEHESSRTAIEIVSTGEIMIFLGVDFIVTVRHGQHSSLKDVRHLMESRPEHLELGPAVVMHQIADTVVDKYLDVVDQVEDDVDDMETAVFSVNSGVGIEQIYLLKREVLELRRSVAPLATPLRRLAEINSPHTIFVPSKVREYFRDVEDHLTQVSERVGAYDEILTTLVNASLAEIATRQNNDMRKISAWAAIALVPTAIAGIYGMNFEYMPELTWRFGYPMVLIVIVGVCVLLYRSLRKRGWL